MSKISWWLIGACAALGAGCAGLPVAQMQLPTELAASAPEPVRGLKAARRGEFALGDLRGSFERSASRLSLFGETLEFDRVGAGYRLGGAGGEVRAQCRGRQTSATVGIVSGRARPYEVHCAWSGPVSAQLALRAVSEAAGTRQARQGDFRTDAATLTFHSVHRVQGSPLPLAEPIGYVFTQGGRAVGAIELNGTTPRLWRPAPGDALHEPVTLAALALALLWDPAERD